MGLEEEIDALRSRLERLARDTDDELLERYELKRPPMPPGLYWKLRWLAGLVLRGLAIVAVWRPDSWPVRLKHSAAKSRARPLLIWAVGAHRDTFRDACSGLSRLEDIFPEFAPVLVTDVPDFAFFSRLGWLVEYLPRLGGAGEPYQERKLKFLARLYRGAPVLPLRAGLETNVLPGDLPRWLNTLEI